MLQRKVFFKIFLKRINVVEHDFATNVFWTKHDAILNGLSGNKHFKLSALFYYGIYTFFVLGTFLKNHIETRPLGVIKLEFEFFTFGGEFAQVGPNVKFYVWAGLERKVGI